MTTTEAAIRDLTASLVVAIAPSIMSGSRFAEHKYDSNDGRDFIDWAESAPDACFRRFSCLDLLNDVQPETTNTTEEWRNVDIELIVAYPRTNRAASIRKMTEAIRSDMTLLEKNVGLIGATNYSTVAAFITSRASTTIQEGNQVRFLRMILPYGFYRSVP